MRRVEDGPKWPLYQYIMKELAQNGCIDVRQHKQFEHLQKLSTGEQRLLNDLTSPCATLSKPHSHAARVRFGLTESRDGTFYGAVVRVGVGQYLWEKELKIGGIKHDTLITDDAIIRKYNGKYWKFRTPKPVTPEPVPLPEPEPEKAVITVTEPVHSDMAEVLAMKDDRIVLRYRGKIVTATITEAFE